MENIKAAIELLDKEEASLQKRLGEIALAKKTLQGLIDIKLDTQQEVKYFKNYDEKSQRILNPKRFTKDFLYKILNKHIITLKYIKTDGSVRVFSNLTLNKDLYEYEPSGKSKNNQRENSSKRDSIYVYDLDDKSLKYLYIDKIIELTIH